MGGGGRVLVGLFLEIFTKAKGKKIDMAAEPLK